MTLVRKMIIATGSLASVATMAQAQHVFPAFNQTNSGTIGNTWQETNLGAAPAGTYTSYLVIMDWTGPGQPANQWSNEVDISMGANSTGALGTANTGPTAASVTPRYVVNAAAATGSAGNTNPVNNMYWTGNFTTTYTGGSNFSFYSHQSFDAGANNNGSHNNVRVILNPDNSGLINDMAAPGAFTDLGTLTSSYGRQTQTVTQATGSQLNWFRFVLPVGVQDGVGALDTLLDIDTAGTTGVNDTEMRLYRVNSAGRLVPAGTGAFGIGEDAHADDDGGPAVGTSASSFGSQLTYGDTNTGAWVNGAQRPYGVATTATGTGLTSLPYNGRDGSLVAGEYFLLVSDYNITETATVISAPALNGAQNGLVGQTSWTVASSGTGGTGTILVNIAFIPTPGSAALLGLGMLAAGRRRRA